MSAVASISLLPRSSVEALRRAAPVTRSLLATPSERKLRKAYEAFNETKEPDAGEAMLAGIRFLQEGLAAIDPASMGLLIIA